MLLLFGNLPGPSLKEPISNQRDYIASDIYTPLERTFRSFSIIVFSPPYFPLQYTCPKSLILRPEPKGIHMYTLLRKEISSFLSSLIGYAVIIVFLLINGLFLWVFPQQFNILDYGFASIDNYFMLAPWVFLFLIPAITMRSFAEEHKAGTMEMLLTKPVTDLEIIGAKYLAGVVLVLFSVLPTLLYYITIYKLGMPPGNLDQGGTMGSYIGLLFLGAGFTAIGIFASAVSNNQIVSFLIAVFLCGFMYIGFDFIYGLSVFGSFGLLVSQLGINAHYTGMSRGVIDTRDVIYFLSLIALFLMLTRFRLERRKW